jgi:hypothetical protein
MPQLFAISGSAVRCTPDAGWRWEQPYDGAVKITADGEAFTVDGKAVLVERDLVKALAQTLAGKLYGVPPNLKAGILGQATIDVDPESLTAWAIVGGARLVTMRTHGTFSVTVAKPAQSPEGSCDSPAPKTGTWEIVEVPQRIATVG